MNTTNLNQAESQALFIKAKSSIVADMESRNIGAIIWDNSRASFHQLPEIMLVSPQTGEKSVARITGLYRFNDKVYLMEEDRINISVDDFYNEDTEVKPTVVTLSEDMAVKSLGNPDEEKGYTCQGTLEEWLVIADCYFEALTEA